MICSKCGGTGEANMSNGMFAWKVECDECCGSGIVAPLTEQEYIQTCTTEQLAEWIISLCVTYFDRTDLSIVGAVKESLKINDHYDGHVQKDLLVEWLKQPHTIKE